MTTIAAAVGEVSDSSIWGKPYRQAELLLPVPRKEKKSFRRGDFASLLTDKSARLDRCLGVGKFGLRRPTRHLQKNEAQ
jgi:hypothetical protein